MLDDIELRNLDKGWLIIRVLWATLYAILGICLIVANISDAHAEINDISGTSDILRYVVCGMALFTFAVSYIIRRLMLRLDEISFNRCLELVPLYHTIRESHDDPVQMILARFVICSILYGTLLAAVGTYGLVVRFATNDFFSLYVLVGVSAIFLYVLRPRKNRLLAMAVEAKRME